MKRNVPSRRFGAVAVVAAACLGLGACSVFNPVTTNLHYNPADGVAANVGTLAVRDLLVISDGKGKATISGNATNLGTEPMTVQFSPEAAQGATPAGGSEVELGPREQVDLATKGLELSSVDAKPGLSVGMTVKSSTAGETNVRVPVLPPELWYSTIAPKG